MAGPFDFIGDAIGSIGGLFSGDFGPSILGGGLSFLGSQLAGRSATDAARTQAESINQAADRTIAAGTPFSVGSIGGTADFDAGTKTALMNLSPELQNIYQGGLTRSGLWGEQMLPFAADPFAAADIFYEQEQPYYQKEEDRLRSALETKLLAQGRLGGTGGREQMSALDEAILRDQDRRRTSSFSKAQGLIDSLLGRESGDIGQATGLLDVPIQLSNVGRGVGASLGGIAASGLASRASAATNLANTMAASGSPMGNALNVAGGMFPSADYIRRKNDRQQYGGNNYWWPGDVNQNMSRF